MDVFLEAWKTTGKSERGYSNNPKDPGGETNWGVTVKVARANGYMGPMRELPQERAQEIAHSEYWMRPKFYLIAALSSRIALELFDTNFNLYAGFAQRSLQRALNASNRQHLDYPDQPVDGNIGPATAAALAAYLKKRGAEGELVLLRMLNSLQGAEYIRQAEANRDKEEFLYGWFRARVVIEVTNLESKAVEVIDQR